MYGGRYNRYSGHGHSGHTTPSHGYASGGYASQGGADPRPRGTSSGRTTPSSVAAGVISAGAGVGAGAGGGAGSGGGADDRYADPNPSGPPSSRSPHREKRWARRSELVHDTAAKNFMVVIRVRPPLPRELNGDRPFQNVVRVDQSERVITISENLNASLDDAALAGAYTAHTFTFDRVYDQNCTQRKVYETTAKAVVESSLQGYNATIFAYGQTGTGKTYTMEGFNSAEERGIIPRAIEQIFRHIQSSVSPRMRFLVRASYLQIYNEVISDLLKPERSNLVIREDKKKGVFVEGLSEWVVRSPQEIYGLMERGGLMRATGSTRMNELSSRSHAVFIIIAEQSETTYLDEMGKELSPEEFHKLVKSRAHGEHGLKRLEANVRQSFKVGKLNLVDLAGSERVRLTGATGQRLEESKKINQSLSALGNVIAALTDPRGRQHIPYRDSKLTRILEDSLGGNCKTTMMAMISPALESFVESLSTLKFANRAKNIKNEARVNEDLDQKSLLRRYERELKRLRSELEERHKNVVDKRKLLELEEERRRAEADKMAAIRELEARSRAFMREKQEKKKLEHRISVLQGQMLIGGGIKDTPAFRNAIKEHQEKIRAEYDKKLSELEKERETIEEEKAQVDKYKKLLVKQRDIMVMLTQRLNERDEQIVALQDELDAYDRHQQELEEKLDEKTAALIHLQRVTMEHNAASPVKNNELEQALGVWGRGNGRGRGPRGVGGEGGGAHRGGGGGGAGAGDGAVPPTLLITTKQFRPYRKAQTVFSGSGVEGQSNDSGNDEVLLSAEEKMEELTRLVTAAESEQARLAKVLEEVQAEKVSTEYLLREKLEKIVQSEIEARLAGFRRDDRESPDTHRLKTELDRRTRELAAVRAEHSAAEAEIQRLHRRIAERAIAKPADTGPNSAAALQRRITDMSTHHAAFRADMAARLEEKNTLVKRLEDQLREAQAQQAAGSQETSARVSKAEADVATKVRQLEQQARTLQQLRNKCTIHAKERRAIQTIIEQKIKALVDTIATVSATAATGVEAPRLQREVQALQRLVNASINALRNSEAESNGRGGASSSSRSPHHRSPGARSDNGSSGAPSSARGAVTGSSGVAQSPYTRYSSSYTQPHSASRSDAGSHGAAAGTNGRAPYTHRYGSQGQGSGSVASSATAPRYTSTVPAASGAHLSGTPSQRYRPSAAVEAMLQSHKAKAAWQASRRVL